MTDRLILEDVRKSINAFYDEGNTAAIRYIAVGLIAEVEKTRPAEGENPSEYILRQIEDIFLRAADAVANEVWDLEYPFPLFHANIAMTNAWINHVNNVIHAKDTNDD